MFDRIACAVSRFAGSSTAFFGAAAVVVASLVAWVFLGFSEPFLDAFNICISIVSLLMLVLIQSSQNAGDAATHAKLDELIRSSDARDEFRGIDRKTGPEIEALRDG